MVCGGRHLRPGHTTVRRRHRGWVVTRSWMYHSSPRISFSMKGVAAGLLRTLTLLCEPVNDKETETGKKSKILLSRWNDFHNIVLGGGLFCEQGRAGGGAGIAISLNGLHWV